MGPTSQCCPEELCCSVIRRPGIWRLRQQVPLHELAQMMPRSRGNDVPPSSYQVAGLHKLTLLVFAAPGSDVWCSRPCTVLSDGDGLFFFGACLSRLAKVLAPS